MKHKQKKHFIARILLSHPAIMGAPDQLEKVERQLWKMKKVVLQSAAAYRSTLMQDGYPIQFTSLQAVAFAISLNRAAWQIEANTERGA